MKKFLIVCFMLLLFPIKIVKASDYQFELNVTVSTSMSITMKADGTTSVSNISAKNNSKLSDVYIKSMKLISKNGWSIESEYTNMTKEKSDTKAIKFGLNRNNDIEWFDEDEGLNINDTLTKNQTKTYSFNVERTAFTKRINTQNAFNLEITITDIPYREYAHEPEIMEKLINEELFVSSNFYFDESTGTIIYDMNYDEYMAIIPKEKNGIPVKIIGQGYSSMLGFRKTVIPNGVTKIEQDAFVDTGDGSNFVLPPSITYIGDGAISMNASSIKFTSVTPPIFDMQYSPCIRGDSEQKIYVPKASLNAYYNATGYNTDNPKVEGKIIGY